MWQKSSSRKGLFLAGRKPAPVLESPYERLRPLTWMPDRCNFEKTSLDNPLVARQTVENRFSTTWRLEVS